MEEICSISAAGAIATDLDYGIVTLFIQDLGCLVLEKTVASLLPHLCAEGVLGLLAFLEELGHFFEAGIGLLLLLFGFFQYLALRL